MSKKNIFLIIFVLLLAALSLYLNKDRFAKDSIQIYHRASPGRAMFQRRPGAPNRPNSPALFFGFDRQLKFTSIKVIPISDIETNRYPHPIWQLISDSNSIPTKGFNYGMTLRGMKPSVPGAPAAPLEPDVKYRLFIEAGEQKAEHDFTLPPQPVP
jgi:hypothetical protein